VRLLANGSRHAYFRPMPRKQLEVPPAVARDFVKIMRAYFAEQNLIKRDQIAGDAVFLLEHHLPPNKRRLRLPDIKDLFQVMKGHPR
jgi:hypothetical protein